MLAYIFPMVLEDTSNNCAAVPAAAARSGAAVSPEVAAKPAAMEAEVHQKYPYVPPQISCTFIYWGYVLGAIST